MGGIILVIGGEVGILTVEHAMYVALVASIAIANAYIPHLTLLSLICMQNPNKFPINCGNTGASIYGTNSQLSFLEHPCLILYPDQAL